MATNLVWTRPLRKITLRSKWARKNAPPINGSKWNNSRELWDKTFRISIAFPWMATYHNHRKFFFLSSRWPCFWLKCHQSSVSSVIARANTTLMFSPFRSGQYSEQSASNYPFAEFSSSPWASYQSMVKLNARTSETHFCFQRDIETMLVSPLKRIIQTAAYVFAPALETRPAPYHSGTESARNHSFDLWSWTGRGIGQGWGSKFDCRSRACVWLSKPGYEPGWWNMVFKGMVLFFTDWIEGLSQFPERNLCSYVIHEIEDVENVLG